MSGKVEKLLDGLKSIFFIHDLTWPEIELACDRDIEELRRLYRICKKRGGRYAVLHRNLAVKLAEHIQVDAKYDAKWTGKLQVKARVYIEQSKCFVRTGDEIDYDGQTLTVTMVDGKWLKAVNSDRKLFSLHLSEIPV